MWDAKHMRFAIEAAEVALWSWNVDTDRLTVLLALYDNTGAFSGRIRVSVPRMGVGKAATTTLTLIVH